MLTGKRDPFSGADVVDGNGVVTCVRILYGTTPLLKVRFCPMNDSLFLQTTYTEKGKGLINVSHHTFIAEETVVFY